MAGMFRVHQTVSNILCCKCGIQMVPNAANMCVNCLRSEVDITEGLQRHVIITHCPDCNRYLQPPRKWVEAQLESKELLTFCLKRLKTLNKVRLIHAQFIWTEPNSKRIKVRLRVQQEVLNGAVLEQAYMVEYVVEDKMCDSCSRVQANPDQWVAVVQLRQHVSHLRTFFYLEQRILRHNAAVDAIRIKQVDHGIDFFFANKRLAEKLVDFIENEVPIKKRKSKQLVSHDTKSNNYNYKYTFSVEICPVCREDLVCLPLELAASLGPLVICTKISNNIALLDPWTLRDCFVDSEKYWRTPFTSLLTAKQLVEFVVLDVDLISSEVNVGGSTYVMADVQVARVSDFGINDTMFFVRTHLGRLLNAGDYALGYDLHAANTNDVELDRYIHKGVVIPDIILVKKSYDEKKPRSWKLKSLNMEVDERGRGDEEKTSKEYEEFLRDLEENPELRFDISLYDNKEYQPSEMTDTMSIEDLLADFGLSNDKDEVMKE